MRIKITEQQFKSITKGYTPDEIAGTLWGAVHGPTTNEELFYSGLNYIKDKSTLDTVNKLLKSKHGQDFYEIINEPLEFETKEKEKIVNILNSKNIPHQIVNGDVVSKVVQNTTQKDIDYYLNNNFNLRRDVVAATLIGEAGGEKNPIKSMSAVLSVLNNRAKIKGTKMANQALIPYQFSMWNDSIDNLPKIKEKINKLKKHPQWNNAISLAKNPKDTTYGATHYYVFQGESKVNPSWKSILKSTLFPSVKNPDISSKFCTACKKKKFCKNFNCFLKVGNHLFGKTSF